MDKEKGNREKMEVAVVAKKPLYRMLESAGSSKGSACKYCGKHNHPHFKCWRRPDVKFRSVI